MAWLEQMGQTRATQGGQPGRRGAARFPQDNFGKARAPEIVLTRERICGLTEGREQGHDQRLEVHACQAHDHAGSDGQEQRVPVLRWDAQGVPQVPQEVAHLPEPVSQCNSAEGAGEPLPREPPREEGGRSAALRRNHGGMLESIGSLLQPAHAVCTRLDVRNHSHQENPVL
jgi:hypothetical protein